ncbi:nitroreductase [Novosphingobium sp. PC22D]|uniref:nitroreductase n=1 Tax=Novosphingobium sp. PC22D TaxID=1962403 RepID=UPI000BEFA53C|nr:nitroreductase [Novosphingobium sp. PC22D]PEQ13342.1 nitroreductase [Novosphingobium sp. PC22D]
MNVYEAVATRRSVRAFLDKPVDMAVVRRVLEAARMAPSGCNYQPWEATVLTGAPLKALQDTLLASEQDDPPEYDFTAPGKVEKYKQRLSTLGAQMYGTMSIGREDTEMRELFSQQNLTSFGAPVLLLSHFPKLMKAPQWSDVGMWLQTVMLLLRDEGLDSCPQEWMGLYGRTIKAHLGMSEDTMLFCGIAIGWRDADHPVNSFERERVPLDEQVTFLG